MAQSSKDAAQNDIRQLSSDDLNIESWERMDHGGHSFVFKVSIDSKISVIKIFRFQVRGPSGKPAPRPDPYLYFNRESTAYRRLQAANLTGTLTPHIYGILTISPAHEARLLSEGKLKGLNTVIRKNWKKKYGHMPLMAVWIEFIGGGRLAVSDVLGEKGGRVKRNVEGALERIHEAGVVQGDVKWRNIMVPENEMNEEQEGVSEKRIVWVDFSNATTIEDGLEKEVWEAKAGEEAGKLREMLARHEPVSPAAFEFEAIEFN